MTDQSPQDESEKDLFDHNVEQILSKSKLFVVSVVAMMLMVTLTVCWAIVVAVLHYTR